MGLWLLGASDCADDEAPSSDVFLHPALGEAWIAVEPLPTAIRIASTAPLGDGRLLVAGRDEARSVYRREVDGRWVSLGSFPASDEWYPVLGPLPDGSVAA